MCEKYAGFQGRNSASSLLVALERRIKSGYCKTHTISPSVRYRGRSQGIKSEVELLALFFLMCKIARNAP
jgi:hypothetical protein